MECGIGDTRNVGRFVYDGLPHPTTAFPAPPRPFEYLDLEVITRAVCG